MKQKEKLLLQLPLIIFVTVLLRCTTSNAPDCTTNCRKSIGSYRLSRDAG